jgi:hypothetical protein
VRKVYHDKDVLTGDHDFDELIVARGPAAEVLGSLNSQAREAARYAIVEMGARVREGTIVLERKGVVEDGALLSVLARGCVALGSALRVDGVDAARRLYQRFDQDSNDKVRTRCFATLVSRFPDDFVTKQAVTQVLESVDSDLKPGAEDTEARLLALLSRKNVPLVCEASAWALGRMERSSDATSALQAVVDDPETSSELARIAKNSLQKAKDRQGQ